VSRGSALGAYRAYPTNTFKLKNYRFEALFNKRGAGERELIMQFAEGLMGLRSGASARD
jgi:hypothetical protein